MVKQSLVVASILFASTLSLAQENTAFVGVDIGRITSHIDVGDAKANSQGIFAGYRYYLSNTVSLEGSLNYTQYKTDMGTEKFYLPQVGIGYDFKATEDLVVRPKFKLGREYISAPGGVEPSSYQVNTKAVALELQFKKNYSVEYSYRKAKNSETDNYSNNISFIYNF